MRLGGLEKLTLIDFPGKVAATIFTQGCPFRCHFCHNPALVLPDSFTPPLDENEFFSFLESRKKKLDGVVISGGEPTIQSDLEPFIAKIKAMGFLVKLDTSGINPDKLSSLIEKDLLDYVAMDIKGSLPHYPAIVGKEVKVENIKASIELLLENKIPYEFRTTLVASLHTEEEVMEILEMIRGANRYVLQSYRKGPTVNPLFANDKGFDEEVLLKLQKRAHDYVKECLIR